MPSTDVTILHEVGLHARPAAKFSRAAAAFDGAVTVRKGDNEVNAKSLLQVLTLEAQQGDVVTITAEGDGAEEQLQKLKELLEKER